MSAPVDPRTHPDRNCAGIPGDLFLPARGDWQAARVAKRVCFNCPIRRGCRDWALALPPGQRPRRILGGLTYRERQHLAAQRRRATAGT